MSNQTKSKAKAEQWFQAYLEQGPDRSLRKLIAESEQITASRGLGKPPSEATIFRWSSTFGWDKRAKEHDAEVTARARTRLLQRQANMEEERIEATLSETGLIHHVLGTALSIETPRLDDRGNPIIGIVDGRPTPLTDRRPATYADHEPQEWRTILMMLKYAMETDRALLAGAGDRYRQLQEAEAEQGPVILGPEAIMEMGILVGNLVKKLDEASAERRAASELALTDRAPDEPEYESADDPGLEWEEVPDDE